MRLRLGSDPDVARDTERARETNLSRRRGGGGSYSGSGNGSCSCCSNLAIQWNSLGFSRMDKNR